MTASSNLDASTARIQLSRSRKVFGELVSFAALFMDYALFRFLALRGPNFAGTFRAQMPSAAALVVRCPSIIAGWAHARCCAHGAAPSLRAEGAVPNSFGFFG